MDSSIHDLHQTIAKQSEAIAQYEQNEARWAQKEAEYKNELARLQTLLNTPNIQAASTESVKRSLINGTDNAARKRAKT